MSDLQIESSSTKIVLEDGKYTVHHEDGRNLRALRYGQYWRDCVGDKLILSMVFKIEELQERILELETEAKVRQLG